VVDVTQQNEIIDLYGGPFVAHGRLANQFGFNCFALQLLWSSNLCCFSPLIMLLRLKMLMLSGNRNLKWRLAGLFAVFASLFVLAPAAQSATVYKCAAEGDRCVVKIEDGIIGDHVKILDEKAREIAQGRIISRKGAYAVVSVANASKTIRKGYPVIVNIENRKSAFQWAASFSDKD
jgi:hypothetical protein